ncbi:uncharacterized protein [Littorina saxatilis]|uniref:Uncharacterized protein n=1 Tax=Littorina saxatilis TaxID=31220 RepID=A0AAN9GEW8_9CAEN
MSSSSLNYPSPVKISRTRQCQILFITCVAGTVLGLALAGAGVYLSFHLGEHLKNLFNADKVSKLYDQYFDPSKASAMVPLDIITNNFGYTLVTQGLVIFVVNSLGVLAADMRHRSPILLFLILMVMVIMTEVICFVVLVQEGSPLSELGCDAAKKDFADSASIRGKENKENVWLASFYVVMVVLDCCGVEGPGDFQCLYTDKFVPEVCCTREMLLEAVNSQAEDPCGGVLFPAPSRESLGNLMSVSAGSNNYLTTTTTPIPTTTINCTNHRPAPANLSSCTQTRPYTDASHKLHKQKGCYDAIFEVVHSNFIWIIPVFVSLLFMQVLQVVLSVYLMGKRLVQRAKVLDINPL